MKHLNIFWNTLGPGVGGWMLADIIRLIFLTKIKTLKFYFLSKYGQGVGEGMDASRHEKFDTCRRSLQH